MCEKTYPGIVEFGLDTDHVALLFILRPQNLQLCRVERRFRIDGICMEC